MRKEDSAFIVWLRNLDHVKGRVGDTAASAASREAWLEKYFSREATIILSAKPWAAFRLERTASTIWPTAVRKKKAVRRCAPK